VDYETSSIVIYDIEEDELSNQQSEDEWSERLNSLHSVTFTEKTELM
ncbi:hypothetical protein NPIL_219131, partial [Nephila pilipes]